MKAISVVVGVTALGLAVLFAVAQPGLNAQPTDPAIRVGPTDLAGTVASANGPEAGVWVIAETNDLPTKFAKIVVTDDRGRYVMPELPRATYDVWVRGYGLIDSTKLQTTPGKLLNLRAVLATREMSAAHRAERRGRRSSTIRPSGSSC